MKGIWIGVALGIVASACGVNPDRMAVIEKRKAELAAKASGKIELEYSDSDPQPIRDAVQSVNESETKLEESDFDGYMTRRYAALAAVGPLASEEVLSHPKVPIILTKIANLDQKFADAGNARSIEVVANPERSGAASADALYAVQDGLDTCARAYASTSRTETDELYRRYETNLERANATDSQVMAYVGKKPSGAGLIDVPAEIAFCEARMTYKRAVWADEPAAAADLSTEYNGCGYFEVNIEAAQTSPNVFADYTIVGSSSQPQTGVAVACEKMPPASDAPTNVQRPLRDQLLWLAPGDLVSMAGPFEYEQRDVLYKKGTVRVFRSDAPLKTSKCGSEDPTITCEAEGSELAKAFNHAQHYLNRAEHHRAAPAPEKCTEMAQKAFDAANVSTQGAGDKQILTVDKEVLAQAQIVARVEAMKSQASQILSSDWCSKPQ